MKAGGPPMEQLPVARFNYLGLIVSFPVSHVLLNGLASGELTGLFVALRPVLRPQSSAVSAFAPRSLRAFTLSVVSRSSGFVHYRGADAFILRRLSAALNSIWPSPRKAK